MPRSRSSSLLLLSVSLAALSGAETATVLAVPAPDQLLVQWRGIPVVVPLAYVSDAGESCRAKLEQQAKGKSVELQWQQHFGTTPAGAGRLLISLGDLTLNRTVVEAGLAKYQPSTTPDSPADKYMLQAQDKARRSQNGLWAAAAAPAKPAVAAATTPAAPAAVPAKPATSGAFCAELGAKYFYPNNHKAVTGIDPQRLIHYADEAAAKRAGKLPPPAESSAVAPTLANADRLYAEGKTLVSQAVDKGNSPERDQLYGDAFPKLNQATQIYATLVEQQPNDDLEEKMRSCMQLRYSAMKYRRPH